MTVQSACAIAFCWSLSALIILQGAPPSLVIKGDVAKPLTLSVQDVRKLPRTTVQVSAGGVTSSYEGVKMVDLLNAAGVEFDEASKPGNLARYMIVEGADQYRAVFALMEFDPSLTDKIILIADKKDGQDLPSSEGPFRSIVPDEKRQMRWVKQTATLTVTKATTIDQKGGSPKKGK